MMQPPQFGVKLQGLDTSTPGVILYGVSPDSKVVPIKVDDTGALSSAGSGGAPTGSTNSFFTDQTGVVLGASFTGITFGFTSFNITLANDDTTEVIEFSFNGTNIHGRVLVSEEISMDYRTQPKIYLRTVSGNAANYRLSAF